MEHWSYITANGVWSGTFERTYFDNSTHTPHLTHKTIHNNCSIEKARTNISRTVPTNKVCKRNGTSHLLTSIVPCASGGLAWEANTIVECSALLACIGGTQRMLHHYGQRRTRELLGNFSLCISSLLALHVL